MVAQDITDGLVGAVCFEDLELDAGLWVELGCADAQALTNG